MSDDPFFCEDCDMELTHDDIHTASPVPQLDIESYEMKENVAEVYQCTHCGLVIGFEPQ